MQDDVTKELLMSMDDETIARVKTLCDIKIYDSSCIIEGKPRELQAFPVSDAVRLAANKETFTRVQKLANIFYHVLTPQDYEEISSAEGREKIIKAFATINSNVRKGEREYNEMYVSNPNVMGVFAYNPQQAPIDNPIEYIQTKADNLGFLKAFALEKDLPFIIFGD